jgi:hypothetical protein
VNSAVLPMAWQWDVLNPLLLPAASQLIALNYASWDQIVDIDSLTNIDTLEFLASGTTELPLSVLYAQYRALILLSTKLHSTMGTPRALLTALAGLGYPDAKLQEGQNSWGGTQWPSSQGWAAFRVMINLATVPADTDFSTLDKRIRAIANFWKPARWLDSVQYTLALTDTLVPAVSDEVINIFAQRDRVKPRVSDFISAQFGPLHDRKRIAPYFNDRYYFGSDVTFGISQPHVADGPVVVNGAAVDTHLEGGDSSDMFSASSLVGTVDGVNPTFTLSPAPTNGVLIFWNGTLLTEGTQANNGQYLLSGSQVNFNPNAIPAAGIQITAYVY